MRFAEETRNELPEPARPGGDRFVVEVRVQIVGQRRGGRIPQVGRFLQATERDQFEFAIGFRIEQPRRNRILFEQQSAGCRPRDAAWNGGRPVSMW